MKIDKLLDLLYPPSLYCHCCGNLIDETRTYNLCDHCVRHIKWDRGAVRDHKGLSMLRCTEYGIYERTLIFSLKYNGKRYIARDIAEIMRDRLSLAEEDFDLVIPVPMNSIKEGRRGFNQTNLIGKHLAKLTGREFERDLLLRTKDTAPMRGLSPTEREMNIMGCFRLAPGALEKLRDRRILLIDDFYTTGATARECSKALMEAGPSKVLFIAFAAKY